MRLDVTDPAAVQETIRGHAAVMSAIPYYYNGPMARAAVEAGCHFSDLGGNTEIVFEQKKLHEQALAKGVSVIPDCGLAPGMVNILAAEGIRRLDQAEQVKDLRRRAAAAARAAAQLSDRLFARRRARLLHHAVLGAAGRQAGAGGRAERARAGGVPAAGRHARGVPHRRRHQHPAVRVRRQDGRHGVQDAALSRATSPSCGRSGSWGCSDIKPVEVKGQDAWCRATSSSPRCIPSCTSRRARTWWRCRSGIGQQGRQAAQVTFRLIDYYDAEHGISAMMRTTGYSLSITGQMQADGRVTEKGVHTPDEAMPFPAYVDELGRRGVRIEEL